MHCGKREGRARTRGRDDARQAFRPGPTPGGSRLLTAIDLLNVATAPYGVEMLGQQSPGAAGFSVADVGDVNGDGFHDFLIGAPTLNRQSTAFPEPGHRQHQPGLPGLRLQRRRRSAPCRTSSN